jgi:3-hydroxyacyl-[acyl-carrier-protein] dehydratase
MPPTPFFDLGTVDLNRVVATRADIYSVLPQRFEFETIDGVLHIDTKRELMVAYRDIRTDEWWCRGHLPGRPIFPGILMVETAAQMAAYYSAVIQKDRRFMAFGGIDDVKFRDTVAPPAKMILVGRALEIRSRRTIVEIQAFVGERMVFSGKITGLPIE